MGTSDEQAAVSELIKRTRSERSFALLLCATMPEQLQFFEPDGVIAAPAILEGSNA